jgi:hypothetical protein
MKNCFGILPFRFGAAASEDLTDDQISFYQWIVNCVTHNDAKLSDTADKITLSVSLQEIQEKESITFDKTYNFIQKWIDDVNIVVIDIIKLNNTIVPGRSEVHLSSAIVSLLSEQEASGRDVLFIILRTELPPEREASRLALKLAIQSGKIVYISDDGQVLSNLKKEISFDPQEYSLRRKNIRGNPLDLLQLKMIRRLGHFKRVFGGSSYCVRYFYDGSMCDTEIAQLILEYVDNNYNETEKPILFFHCTVSQWLMEAVTAAAIKLNTLAFEVEEFLNDFTDNLFELLTVPPIIIFPLIDTGKTVESIFKKWKKIIGHFDSKLITILTTRSDNEQDRTRNIEVEGHSLNIQYFLNVKRHLLTVKDTCFFCELDIPYSSHKHEDYAMLTSWDIWEMIEEVGWKPEDNIPFYRAGLPEVPKFPEMLNEHGAWLAYKALCRLTFSIEGFPAQPFAIICPEERGTGLITNYLKVIHDGVTVISIHREAIDYFVDTTKDLQEFKSEIETQKPYWYRQLLSIPPSQPVILLEEFCVSGRTRSALLRLLELFRKKVICHFSLIDFSSLSNSELSDKFFSLYHFPLNQQNLHPVETK